MNPTWFLGRSIRSPSLPCTTLSAGLTCILRAPGRFPFCPGKPQVMFIISLFSSTIAATNGQRRQWPIEIIFGFLSRGHTNPLFLFSGIGISITTFEFPILRTEEQAFLFMTNRYRDPRVVLPQRTWPVISKIFRKPCTQRSAGRFLFFVHHCNLIPACGTTAFIFMLRHRSKPGLFGYISAEISGPTFNFQTSHNL